MRLEKRTSLLESVLKGSLLSFLNIRLAYFLVFSKFLITSRKLVFVRSARQYLSSHSIKVQNSKFYKTKTFRQRKSFTLINLPTYFRIELLYSKCVTNILNFLQRRPRIASPCDVTKHR